MSVGCQSVSIICTLIITVHSDYIFLVFRCVEPFNIIKNFSAYNRGVAVVGEVVQPPRTAEPKGRRNG